MAIKLILLCIEIATIDSALIASHVENYMFGIWYPCNTIDDYWIVEKVIGIVPMKISLTILEEYQCMILDKTLHSQ